MLRPFHVMSCRVLGAFEGFGFGNSQTLGYPKVPEYFPLYTPEGSLSFPKVPSVPNPLEEPSRPYMPGGLGL